MSKSVSLLFLLLVCSAPAFAQDQTDGCILNTAKNGQVITVHGKTVHQPHDLAFGIVGCNDLVLLTFAGDRDNDVSADELRKDESLKRFQKYTSAVYKSSKKDICIQCMKYGDVEATLNGKLEVATIPPGTTKDQVGFLHDESGKIVGTSGFGHPTRRFKYRLVILSVADVTARKLPKRVAQSLDLQRLCGTSSCETGTLAVCSAAGGPPYGVMGAPSLRRSQGWGMKFLC